MAQSHKVQRRFIILTHFFKVFGILTILINFQLTSAAPEILNRQLPANQEEQVTTESVCQDNDPDDLEAINACNLIVSGGNDATPHPVDCWVNRSVDAHGSSSAGNDKNSFYFCTTEATLNTIYCLPKGSKDEGPIGTPSQKLQCDEKCGGIYSTNLDKSAMSTTTFYCTYPGTRQKNHFICACTNK